MLNKAIAPLARRISNMLARGAVTLVNASGKLQTLQVSLLADESKDTVDHLEPYGFASNPPIGAEALVAFIDGDRSHGVAIVASDRRYRVQSLASGDIAIYDTRGAVIKLTAAGIAITGGGNPITINGAPAVNISGIPTINVTGGDVVVDGISLKNHHHQEHDGFSTSHSIA